jgi:hypothetical protein
MKRSLALAAALLAAGPIQAQAPEVKDSVGGASKRQPDGSAQSLIEGAFQARLTSEVSQLFEDGDFPRATQIINVQTRHWPDDYERATDLIWMHGNMEQWSLELGEAARFRILNSGDPDAWYPEAQIHFMDRAYAYVIPIMAQAAKISRETGRPLHPNGYRILAHAFNRLQMHAQSLEVWDEYLKLAPDDEAGKRNREAVARRLAEKGGSK